MGSVKNKNVFIVLLAIGMAVFLPFVAHAHVGYVEPRSLLTFNSDFVQFYSELISNPIDVSLLVVISLLALVIIFSLFRVRVLKIFGQRLAEKAKGYKTFVPWIIRLSLGIGLVGAGTSHLLISPTLPISNAFISFEIFAGFCFDFRLVFFWLAEDLAKSADSAEN